MDQNGTLHRVADAGKEAQRSRATTLTKKEPSPRPRVTPIVRLSLELQWYLCIYLSTTLVMGFGPHNSHI
jgi:hypothetical protein